MAHSAHERCFACKTRNENRLRFEVGRMVRAQINIGEDKTSPQTYGSEPDIDMKLNMVKHRIFSFCTCFFCLIVIKCNYQIFLRRNLYEHSKT